MKEEQNYQEDLTHIRDIMERSSRFLSLSGLSGVMAGVYALVGAVMAFLILNQRQELPQWKRMHPNDPFIAQQLILVGVGILVAAIGTGFYLSRRRARKMGVKFMSATGMRLVINLLIPLGTGGLFVLMITYQGYYGLAAPLMLIFYGLSLLNASKYTLPDIRSLGLAEVVLGLINTAFIGYGLYFWAVGFGVLHIIYGIAMYQKYER
ncbi:MAG TPA: hypothetical protein DCE41_09470 [Cytophagales bacterium]|nr:hypothetical protein [Cytophagales bacterium]HAA22479.1 hypothetical protein [Cytophagales bacterium]HAP61582.1 hypothetical protein [Cytophagales bacterium]